MAVIMLSSAAAIQSPSSQEITVESENENATLRQPPDMLSVLDSVERLDTAAIEKEITVLEARVEKLRRLLNVRRGLKPRTGKRGRKRPAPTPESVA